MTKIRRPIKRPVKRPRRYTTIAVTQATKLRLYRVLSTMDLEVTARSPATIRRNESADALINVLLNFWEEAGEV